MRRQGKSSTAARAIRSARRPLAALTLAAAAIFSLAIGAATASAAAPVIPGASVRPSAVTATTALLEGRVNPEGEATTYRFEYGLADCETSSCTSIPASTGNVGAGSAPIAVSNEVTGLQPGATYHFRLVATNASDTVASADRTFNTYSTAAPAACANDAVRTGAAASLPDCRAYEMVSPVDKNGGDIVTLCNNTCFRAGYSQGTVDGERFTYSSYKSFGDALGSYYSNQYLATRGPNGWTSHGLNPLHSGKIFPEYNITWDLDLQFKLFTPDLGTAVVTDDAKPALTPDASEGKVNLYARDNGTGTYRWIAGVGPMSGLEVQGSSADGNHVLFKVEEALTPEAGSPGPQLYDYSGGELHLVNVRPGGEVSARASLGSSVGIGGSYAGRDRNVQNAISADGSRVFWTDADGFSQAGTIYVRIDNQETIDVSGIAGSLPATYWTASEDGSTAVFTIGAELYSVDVDDEVATPIAGEVKGVLGASSDASRIYFVTLEDLGDGGVAGKPNVYLYDDGDYVHVATVAKVDIGNGQGEGLVSGYDIAGQKPVERPSRVTPDGLHVAFQSIAKLTPYDNQDANNGEANVEVYAFDAAADHLACVSCNPSGARPQGQPLQNYDRADDSPANNNGGPERRWTGAWLPGSESAYYIPNALSEDGTRVFFNSFDPLLPQDTNGRQDVYEWEAVGAGSCREGGPGYSRQDEGCISLISSGTSPAKSEFVDADPTGASVYFTTNSSLLPQDPGLVDLYVARVGGGFSTPSEPVACEGEACQTPPAPPNNPTPASLAFEGPGNPPPAKAAKKKKGGNKKHRKTGKKHRKKSKRHGKNHGGKHSKKHKKGHKNSKQGKRAHRNG